MQRHGDLDIRRDPDYHRRLFTFQRIGWVLLAAFVLAAVLGLIGAAGPLNTGQVGNALLRVEYERFPHQESRTQVRITLQGLARDAHLRLWLDAGYLNHVRVEHISPKPDRVIASQGGFEYLFTSTPPSVPMTVALLLTPEAAGRLHGEIRAGVDGAPVRFSQFVYP